MEQQDIEREAAALAAVVKKGKKQKGAESKIAWVQRKVKTEAEGSSDILVDHLLGARVNVWWDKYGTRSSANT